MLCISFPRAAQAWALVLQRPCFALLLPAQKHCARLRSVQSLARLLHVALRTRVRSGPYVLAGVGHGAVIAHELGVQLRAAGEVVQALVVLESAALREAWEACSQPWIQVSMRWTLTRI
jgi:thioesterase domain-containing protein